LENKAFIYLTAIDRAATRNGFNIGVSTYDTLKGDGGEGVMALVQMIIWCCLISSGTAYYVSDYSFDLMKSSLLDAINASETSIL